MNNRRLVLCTWLLGAFALTLPLTVQPFRYGDEWWHIALGRQILAHGIPVQEPFSFIATQHQWVEQQWLFEIVLAKLVDIGGAGLASLTMGLVGSAAMVVAALAIPGRAAVGGGWRAAAMLTGALVAGPALGVRGEVISVLGVAATLLLVQRWRSGSAGALWLLPPLFLVWANSHSGFIAGLAVLGFTLIIHLPARRPGTALRLGLGGLVAAMAAVTAGLIVGTVVLVVMWGLIRPVPRVPGVSRSRLAAFTAAALVATLINPAGPGIYAYVAETLSNPLLTQFVSEWQSPNFHDTLTRLIEVVAGLLVLTWVLSQQARAEDVLLAAGAFLATLQAVRNVSLLAVVAVPQLAEYGAATWALRAPRQLPRASSPLLAVGAAGVILVASAASLVARLAPSAAADFERSREPTAAADYVAGHFAGQRLLSSDLDGGYLAYRFPAGRVVFVYDEIGLFGKQPLTDYQDLAGVHADWKSVLERLGFQHAVLAATAADTSALIELGWTVDCYDKRSDRVVLSAHPGAASPTPPPPADAPGCA